MGFRSVGGAHLLACDESQWGCGGMLALAEGEVLDAETVAGKCKCKLLNPSEFLVC